MLWSHLKGKSIRTLAQEQGKSLCVIQKQLHKEINELPENELITVNYCNRSKWGGVLLVDAKYVKVKGYNKKIAFIYGMDYLTHDIPVCMLFRSESFLGYKQFFMALKNSNYRLRAIVTDEHDAILPACHEVFHEGILRQLCQFHFLKKIRDNLGVRRNDTYVPFVNELASIVFNTKKFKGKKRIKKELHELAHKYIGDMPALDVLVNISDHLDELTNYIKIGQCPRTNNLIEGYNSQLEGRLKTIRGFNCFKYAKKWLNAWILCRRLTTLYDCEGFFKKLNGKSSLEISKKSHLKIPDFLPKF